MRGSEETQSGQIKPNNQQKPQNTQEIQNLEENNPAERAVPAILDLRSLPPQEVAVLMQLQSAPDRWTLLWRAKVWIALATLAAGAIAYVASSRIPASYQASSLV